MRCAKPGCKATPNPGKQDCGKHRGHGWNSNFRLFSAKDKPTRRPK
jgi:hypothetical protein